VDSFVSPVFIITDCRTAECFAANLFAPINMQFCDTIRFPDGCVRSWFDLSTFDRTYGQDNAPKPGRMLNCVNGHPCVRGGTMGDDPRPLDVEMEGSEGIGGVAGPFSIFHLARPIPQPSNYYYFGASNNGLEHRISDNSLRFRVGGTLIQTVSVPEAITLGQWQLIEVHRDAAGDLSTVIDGVDTSVDPKPNRLGVAMAMRFIMSRDRSLRMYGEIAATAVYEGTLTEPEKQQIRDYLQGIYNYLDDCVGDDATGDSDNDGVCNDTDVCNGLTCPVDNLVCNDDNYDDDGDGIPNGCDLCRGDNASGDTDGDKVCDDVDLCAGDDTLDEDFDTIPDDCDDCFGANATGDDDMDGFCNNKDVCLGDDNSGDTDNDDVCNDIDACAGFDDGLDADADTVPDDCDICSGNDDRLDADTDTVPDGCDACPGFDDNADADADTVPDGCDVCADGDDLVDTDDDTVPDDCDLCADFDDRIDADLDTIPDECDLCIGDNASGDSNGDGICNNLDVFADGFESGNTALWSSTVGG
jgi:hypothetical protein